MLRAYQREHTAGSGAHDAAPSVDAGVRHDRAGRRRRRARPRPLTFSMMRPRRCRRPRSTASRRSRCGTPATWRRRIVRRTRCARRHDRHRDPRARACRRCADCVARRGAGARTRSRSPLRSRGAIAVPARHDHQHRAARSPGLAAHRGRPILRGWALDPEGRPETNARRAIEARRLTPLGGSLPHGSHKLRARDDGRDPVGGAAGDVRANPVAGDVPRVGHFFPLPRPAPLPWRGRVRERPRRPRRPSARAAAGRPGRPGAGRGRSGDAIARDARAKGIPFARSVVEDIRHVAPPPARCSYCAREHRLALARAAPPLRQRGHRGPPARTRRARPYAPRATIEVAPRSACATPCSTRRRRAVLARLVRAPAIDPRSIRTAGRPRSSADPRPRGPSARDRSVLSDARRAGASPPAARPEHRCTCRTTASPAGEHPVGRARARRSITSAAASGRRRALRRYETSTFKKGHGLLRRAARGCGRAEVALSCRSTRRSRRSRRSSSERPDVLVGYGGWLDLFFRTVTARGLAASAEDGDVHGRGAAARRARVHRALRRAGAVAPQRGQVVQDRILLRGAHGLPPARGPATCASSATTAVTFQPARRGACWSRTS